MAQKVRLDLMVDPGAKEILQEIARTRKSSMSEVVEQLILEHLMRPYGAVEEHDDSLALFDMLRILELQDRVTHAIAEGKIWSFETYCGMRDDERDPNGIVYIPTDCEHYGIIVAQSVVDEYHSDVVATYGGDAHSHVLSTVDVYLSWYKEASQLHPCGLCIVPKGKSPTGFAEGEPYDWNAPVTWPEGIREEWNED